MRGYILKSRGIGVICRKTKEVILLLTVTLACIYLKLFNSLAGEDLNWLVVQAEVSIQRPPVLKSGHLIG